MAARKKKAAPKRRSARKPKKPPVSKIIVRPQRRRRTISTQRPARPPVEWPSQPQQPQPEPAAPVPEQQPARRFVIQQPAIESDEGLTRAERNIRWCEDHLHIPEGKYFGTPLKMAPFMKDDFYAIYDNPYGTRRAIISRGRKNANTVETAMLLLLHLCGKEVKPNSQLYSTAQSRDQAALVFDYAAKMVRLSPKLNAVIVIRDTAKQLVCPGCGTVYRALSAETTTAFGLSPAFCIHDELGQVYGREQPKPL
jgi:phage terminase large subunit-like protein